MGQIQSIRSYEGELQSVEGEVWNETGGKIQLARFRSMSDGIGPSDLDVQGELYSV